MLNLNKIEAGLANASTPVFNSIAKEIIYQEFDLGLNPGTVVNLGDLPGSSKTRKGTPDIYFLFNGKFVYVEITSQTKNLHRKIHNDIFSCIDKIHETKIEQISKLIYISNSKIDSKYIVKFNNILKDYCYDSVAFDFWGIDKLSLLIATKYEYIASEYLEINDGVFHFHTLDEVLKTNYFDTPQNYMFHYREEEKSLSKKELLNGKIVLLYGNPGCGKTRLAIEVAKSMIEDGDVEEAYIFRRDSIFSLDEISKLKKSSRVVILDDINRMPSWPDFIEYSFHNPSMKIIMTVRDYAFENIMITLNKYNLSHTVFFVEIKSFNESQIKEIIHSEIKGSSIKTVEDIVARSRSNLRFSVMTTELLKKNGDIPETTEQIFDQYFSQVSSDLEVFSTESNQTNFDEYKKILALVSLLGKIVYDYDDRRFIPSIFEEFSISEELYLNAVRFWERKEVINTKLSGKLVEVADQILSDYIFYKVVYIDKLLDISKIINFMITSNRHRLVDLFQSILNMYGYSDLVKQSVENTWNRIKETANLSYKLEFLNVFSQLLRDETIWFYDEYCLDIPLNNFNVLSHFESETNFSVALDILFRKLHYIESTKLQDFFQLIEKNFWITENSHNYKYKSQMYLIEKFISSVNSGLEISTAFAELVKKLLMYSIEWNSWTDTRTLTIHTLRLTGNIYIYNLRKKVFDLLFLLYTRNPVMLIRVTNNVYFDFVQEQSDNLQLKDREYLISNLENFDYSKLEDSAFVINLIYAFFGEVEIEDIEKSIIQKIIGHEHAKFYYLHKLNETRFGSENDNQGLSKIFSNVLEKERYVDYLMRFYEFNSINKWALSSIIEYFFIYLSEKEEKITNLFKYLIAQHRRIEIQPLGLLRYMVTKTEINEIYLLIETSDLVEKDMWLIQLFTLYKIDQINDDIYNRMLSVCLRRHISNNPKSSWGNERLSSLYNFEKFKNGFFKSIFEKVFENVILGKADSFRFVEDLYHFKNGFFDESSGIDEHSIKNIFGKETESLFFELYFRILESEYNNFYDELFIVYLMSKNIEYLYRYYDIKLNKGGTVTNFQILRKLKDKKDIIEKILINHLMSYKYFLSHSIMSIFSTVDDENTIIDILDYLILHFIDDRKRLSKIVELFGGFSENVQVSMNKRLIFYKVDPEVYSLLPLFWGPSSWSGSRIPILLKQKSIATKVFEEVEKNESNLVYLKDIRKKVDNLSKQIKHEELYEFTQDLG